MKIQALLLVAIIASVIPIQAQHDKYLWLEEVDGKEALEFAKSHSEATFEKLSLEKDFHQIYNTTLEISNSEERITFPTIQGNYVYNFWKDKNNERGIWRRTLYLDYIKGNPNWETLIDIDELSKKDKIKWVYIGAIGLYPSYDRFLVRLSKGGGDAVIIKEFDVNKKEFIENGFLIDEAKSDASYVDQNTLIVSTDFGEGTLTTSGYPRDIKIWKRGTPLKDAQIIFKGESSDVRIRGFVLRDGQQAYTLINRAITFFTSQHFIWIDQKAIKLDIPDDIKLTDLLNNQLIIQLKSDWTVNSKTYKTGSLISLNFSELLKGNKIIKTIIEPDKFSSIEEIISTKNKLLINLLTNVTSQLFIYSFSYEKWSSQKVDAPDYGTISIVTTNDLSDEYFFKFENFITPTTLYYANASSNNFKVYKSLPAYFDASNYEVNQYKAKSKDGTLIPYFMVSKKGMIYNGKNPTLVYAYGGFEISLTPFYSPTFGTSWLEKGGVLIIANIRGGGEYGPKWHQEGLKEKRQNTFDDLYAVSEDLISKKVTSSKHLGIMGGSNGGLLVAVAFTQRPDLYNAVVCQVPLLDMQRYNKLLAGASWMDEYGNPDVPEEWEYLKKYSPYHNLKEGSSYPEVFFFTSTRDDRVHPAHARKMVAKMKDMAFKTFYYEITEGGHAGSSTNEQSSTLKALTYSYLLMKLK